MIPGALMSLVKFCLSSIIGFVLIASLSTVAHSITLNFKANIVAATCSISLSHNALSLGVVNANDLKPNQLANGRPFTLYIRDCIGQPGANQKPRLKFSGEGINDMSGWLFRQSGSTANNVGIALYQNNTMPQYGDLDRINNNTEISFAHNGSSPVIDEVAFYAALSCGSNVAACQAITTGKVTARVVIDFEYR